MTDERDERHFGSLPACARADTLAEEEGKDLLEFHDGPSRPPCRSCVKAGASCLARSGIGMTGRAAAPTGKFFPRWLDSAQSSGKTIERQGKPTTDPRRDSHP